jgi:hypothetical protein
MLVKYTTLEFLMQCAIFVLLLLVCGLAVLVLLQNAGMPVVQLCRSGF